MAIHMQPTTAQRQMRKKKLLAPDPILPTPMEELLGEIWDPRGHEEIVATANAVLEAFVQNMEAGRLPVHTLGQIRDAVHTIGHFAGYPRAAHEIEMFLESPIASSSYKGVAGSLPTFIEDMNNRIARRTMVLSARRIEGPIPASKNVNDCEIPF
jgi:hypothetical protein